MSDRNDLEEMFDTDQIGYPRFAGFGSFELVFTQSRILALVGTNVQVWRAATGPMPTSLLAT